MKQLSDETWDSYPTLEVALKKCLKMEGKNNYVDMAKFQARQKLKSSSRNTGSQWHSYIVGTSVD